MLSVVTQDDLSKYDIHNYHIVEIKNNPGADIYADTFPDGERIELGCYNSHEDAAEVFKQMTAYEEQNKIYFMPTQEVLEEARGDIFENVMNRMACTIRNSGGQDINNNTLRRICVGLYDAGYHRGD